MVMNRTDGEKRRNRNPGCRGSAIGENEDFRSGVDCFFGLSTNGFECLLEAIGSFRCGPSGIDHEGAEAVLIAVGDRVQFLLEKDSRI